MTASLLRLAVVAGLVVGLDQWTKDWAGRTLAGRPPIHVIGDLVQFTYTRNSGVAFGLGAGLPFPYYLFSIAAAAAILWLFLAQRIHGTVRQFALALVMGGALGNLIDRVATGEVVDFVLLSWRQWQFPVFNVADSAVTTGVALFVLARHPHHDAEGLDAPGAGGGGAGATAAGGAAPAAGAGDPAAVAGERTDSERTSA
jgi:signal peptidase II